jgi:microcompartment protein CcmL/EutN
MKKYPAIALLEISGIATGIYCADAMIKSAPITVLKSGTVHNGKFLILIGGSVASVEESFYKGLTAAKDEIIDHVFLPDIHQQVHDAILGQRTDCSKEAIGIIETASVAAIIKSTDAAIKQTDISIVEIRIADHLGGKAFSIINGEVEDIESAVEIAQEKTTKPEFWLGRTVIPNLHQEIGTQIAQSTYFGMLEIQELAEGEI